MVAAGEARRVDSIVAEYDYAKSAHTHVEDMLDEVREFVSLMTGEEVVFSSNAELVDYMDEHKQEADSLRKFHAFLYGTRRLQRGRNQRRHRDRSEKRAPAIQRGGSGTAGGGGGGGASPCASQVLLRSSSPFDASRTGDATKRRETADPAPHAAAAAAVAAQPRQAEAEAHRAERSRQQALFDGAAAQRAAFPPSAGTESAGRRGTLDVRFVRENPLLSKVLALVQLDIVSLIGQNYAATCIMTYVDVNLAPMDVWRRVRHYYDCQAEYAAEIVTATGESGDRTALVIQWS